MFQIYMIDKFGRKLHNKWNKNLNLSYKKYIQLEKKISSSSKSIKYSNFYWADSVLFRFCEVGPKDQPWRRQHLIYILAICFAGENTMLCFLYYSLISLYIFNKKTSSIFTRGHFHLYVKICTLNYNKKCERDIL